MLDAPVIAPQDELLSVPQLAKAINVSRYTAHVYVLSGKIRGREAAGRLIVRRQDVEEFKRNREIVSDGSVTSATA